MVAPRLARSKRDTATSWARPQARSTQLFVQEPWSASAPCPNGDTLNNHNPLTFKAVATRRPETRRAIRRKWTAIGALDGSPAISWRSGLPDGPSHKEGEETWNRSSLIEISSCLTGNRSRSSRHPACQNGRVRAYHSPAGMIKSPRNANTKRSIAAYTIRRGLRVHFC